jgi:hypothetical protein
LNLPNILLIIFIFLQTDCLWFPEDRSGKLNPHVIPILRIEFFSVDPLKTSWDLGIPGHCGLSSPKKSPIFGSQDFLIFPNFFKLFFCRFYPIKKGIRFEPLFKRFQTLRLQPDLPHSQPLFLLED